ncbi:MAG: bifunctional riboflavin kinase/FAD synthetase [Chloroflexi bacterium]|nr:bifunctional riboflavin kinase/FAD synthetase [Chloroflexota bacterium]MBU1747038.1 bifunctional riboflavin kinase/FAD synthetase [Chloroflexota bacterium]MBU1879734.1 bifunctional riboflavin kinase/FAD synthetase [Chloroflexota bacterium]
MRVLRGLAALDPDIGVTLTVGAFDGVHRGHQQLITQLRQRAAALGGLSAVITFDPHPRAVLAPDNSVPYLTTLDEKIVLLEQAGVDVLIILTFTREMADMPAGTFLQLVQDYVNIQELMVGPDFALGRQREGTLPLLEQVGERLGFGVRSVMPLLVDGHMISSTRIRQTLAQGRVREAARLLGRPYRLYGEVVPGAQRSSELGVPTANLVCQRDALCQGLAMPADGVYATYALLDDEPRPAVTNVGVRPTLGDGEHLVATHILDVDEDLYGRMLGVEFIQRLRDEQWYEHPDQLVAQIQQDVRQARALLLNS